MSSGCMTSPYRSNERKSSVSASATPGPPRPNAVYAMAYLPSSSTNVIRGSSIPQSSSGYFSGSARIVGSVSTCQPSMPFFERAAHRWEWPRRSSTRQRRSVVPSRSLATPALKTV